MYKYDKSYFERQAQNNGFVRDNLEKVYRLVDVLEYMNQNPMLKNVLALKGGTAINLLIFNMPRLSVDIDLDFCMSVTRDEMLEYRKKINEDIINYLYTQGYTLNLDKGKNPHSLDSWVFWYKNTAGNRDNIKVEINYSMREHVFPIQKMMIQTDFLEKSVEINTLSPIELFGSKINALISRMAPRDLFDVNNMVYFNTFDESEYSLLRKCLLFYYTVGSSKEIKKDFDFSAIEDIKWHNIQQALLPMLRKKEQFDFEAAKKRVKDFLGELLKLTPHEKEFLTCFVNKEYKPELLFDNEEIVERIRNHPMALWKTRDEQDK